MIKFDRNKDIEKELARVRDKLSSLGPEVIRRVVTLGRLDKIQILDIDPSTSEQEVLGSHKAAVPRKSCDMVGLAGLWKTSSGYAMA